MKKIAKTFILVLSILCLAAFAACGSISDKSTGSSNNVTNEDSGWTGNY